MPTFSHGAIDIAYLDEGEGEPILLIHGFASSKDVNWVQPGWVSTLVRAGHRAIAFDNRGHGASSKLYDPAEYHTTRMAEDAIALLDHLGIARCDVMGYSMGARIAAFLTHDEPARVCSLVIAGLGDKLVDGVGLPENIAVALEAPSLDDVSDPVGRVFRSFAEQNRSDLRALAACIRGSRQVLGRDAVAKIETPTLIAVGTRDDVAGAAQALAEMMPNAKVLDIPNRDHMRSVGDRVFKDGVLEFLRERT